MHQRVLKMKCNTATSLCKQKVLCMCKVEYTFALMAYLCYRYTSRKRTAGKNRGTPWFFEHVFVFNLF